MPRPNAVPHAASAHVLLLLHLVRMLWVFPHPVRMLRPTNTLKAFYVALLNCAGLVEGGIGGFEVFAWVAVGHWGLGSLQEMGASASCGECLVPISSLPYWTHLKPLGYWGECNAPGVGMRIKHSSVGVTVTPPGVGGECDDPDVGVS